MKPNKFVEELTVIFKKYVNAKEAEGMRKYMKDQFVYFGIKKPIRTLITKPLLLKAKESISEEWILETAELLWNKKEREYLYLALELFNANKKIMTVKSFKKLEKLLLQHSWWDSVDNLSSYAISPLVLKCPELRSEMERYTTHKNKWCRRVAIIDQLKYKTQTDKKFLFETCLINANEPDFFIRKAIGWALREYAKTNPKDVYAFVKANENILSKLSVTEALKHK